MEGSHSRNTFSELICKQIARAYKQSQFIYAGYKIACRMYEENHYSNRLPLEITNDQLIKPVEPLKPDLYSSEIDDQEIIDHEKFFAVDEIYKCPISKEIMIVPYILTSCGHSFEKKCIVEWVQDKELCPICGKKAGLENLLPNFSVKDILVRKRIEIINGDIGLTL